MKNTFRRFGAGLLATLIGMSAIAAPPKTLSYQGVLTNAAAVPVNGAPTFVFSLYDAAVGGTLLWSENQSVTVANGLFSVTLGLGTPLTLAFDATYYLGVKVGTDAEMLPRQPLAASAYAITALGLDASATVSGSAVVGPISAAQGLSNGANTAVGVNALSSPNAFGQQNTAFGASALQANTNSFNTAIGFAALMSNLGGISNTAVGRNALLNNSGGSGNTSVGDSAMLNTSSNNNIAIGRVAGLQLTSGGDNIAIGNQGVAGESSTIRLGDANQTRAFIAGIRGITPASSDVLPVIIDVNGQLGTSSAAATSPVREPGTANTFAGSGAGNTTLTGNSNAAFGSSALVTLTSGSANTALGVQALSAVDSGANNAAFGRSALRFATGNNNIGIGAGAGSLITTGSNNIAIGNNGIAADVSTIRIGSSSLGPYRAFVQGIRGVTPASTDVLPVVIDINGQLGTSSAAATSPVREPGIGNTFAGGGAGNVLLTGDGNVAFGSNALPVVTTGVWNASTGYRSLLLNQDGSYNTANGLEALAANVSGSNNTAIGIRTLLNSTAGNNTAIGANAGSGVTTGGDNIAIGAFAGNALTTGGNNIAIGNVGVAAEADTTRIGTSQTRAFIAGVRGVATGNANALPVGVDSAGQLGTLSAIPGSLISGPIFAAGVGGRNTIIGSGAGGNTNHPDGDNTAVGFGALAATTSGDSNTAMGSNALPANNSYNNVAVGASAQFSNVTGPNNVAMGVSALFFNNAGNDNTAIGHVAARDTTGSNNIALGSLAGFSLTNGSNNIAIGNQGVAGESNTIRIGNTALQTRAFMAGINGVTSSGGVQVYINSAGQLGTLTSSARFKENIASMDDASADLMRLNPVTFNYLDGQDDGQKLTQYGLIAEEVAEVYPDLVVKTPDGKAETVRYHFLTPMLLNEVQKQQRKLMAQAHDMQRQADELAAQRDKVAALEGELAEIKKMLRNRQGVVDRN